MVTLSCDSASPHVTALCTFSHCFSFAVEWYQELLGFRPLELIESERWRVCQGNGKLSDPTDLPEGILQAPAEKETLPSV